MKKFKDRIDSPHWWDIVVVGVTTFILGVCAWLVLLQLVSFVLSW